MQVLGMIMSARLVKGSKRITPHSLLNIIYIIRISEYGKTPPLPDLDPFGMWDWNVWNSFRERNPGAVLPTTNSPGMPRRALPYKGDTIILCAAFITGQRKFAPKNTSKNRIHV